MKELYTSPKAEIVEFEVKDVITTSDGSGSIINQFNGVGDNGESGWTGLY